MNTKFIAEQSRVFRNALKSGDLNGAEFALENLWLALNDYNRELEAAFEKAVN